MSGSAIFGTTTTTQFLTSGIGLLVFILYLPGGMAELLHRLGDLATSGVQAARQRWGPPPPGGTGRQGGEGQDGGDVTTPLAEALP